MFNSLQLALVLVASICLFIKFIFWRRLSGGRPPFLFTLFGWASVHDIHNAGSAKSKMFFKSNNILNLIIWGCLALFAFSYLSGDGSEIKEKPPTFDPKAIF